jgi:hypothetical protein
MNGYGYGYVAMVPHKHEAIQQVLHHVWRASGMCLTEFSL